jgi:fatty acid desaturase
MAQTDEYIDPLELKALSRLEPWRFVLAILLDWAVIAVAIAVCEWTDSWLSWLIAVPVIAGRMHALAILLHDFAHYRFIRNKRRSDWVGDLFVAWPIGATLSGYRSSHLAHHRYLNSGKDPDWTIKFGTRMFTFPQEMRFALLNFIGYFVGVSSIRDIRIAYVRLRDDDKATWRYKAVRIGYYLAIAAALTFTGAWSGYFLYWAIPYLTLFYLLLYIRSVADHFGETLRYSSELDGTRTIIPYFWERWFFCPHHINFHIEHHIYPSVPFFNLPKLNRVLMRNRRFSTGAHLTRGFVTGLLREVWLDSWRSERGKSVSEVAG